MTRIVVIGGNGNFGARICRALAGDADIEVMAAGRRTDRDCVPRPHPAIGYATLDCSAPDFARQLKHLAPRIVIHCAGPFQGQDYRVAIAAVEAGAHYIDIADGRDFVVRFADNLDAPARAANVLAVSGASSVPALSSAVVDACAGRLQRVRAIRIAIAPAQRAARGAATLAGVFSYAGKPLRWLSGGQWRTVHGWQALQRLRFAQLGSRWSAACDVPDLELLPARYPSVDTVEFRAALELGVQHFALWLAAAMRRFGLPLPLEHWARTLDRISAWLDRYGSERGGMLVSVAGIKSNGQTGVIDWHITADDNHGPEIPCMAATLLARKLARGEIALRGATPCVGLLTLADFEPEFARWAMSTCFVEHTL